MTRAAVWCAALLVLFTGCARLVTKDRETIARLNDPGWTIKQSPSPPVTPVPFHAQPEVARALRSAPDALGIPRDLYAVDPLLWAYRKEMEAQASARRAVGTGSIIYGLVFGGLSAWLIGAGRLDVNSTDPQKQSSANDAIAWGVIGATMSLGAIVAGIVTMASSSNAAPLQSYYRETYVAPLR